MLFQQPLANYDIAHAIWTGDVDEESSLTLKTPLEKDSMKVVYTFQNDTIITASTLFKDKSAMTITIRQYWLAGTKKFNETVQTVHRHLMDMRSR